MKEAFGMLITDNGGSFDLSGDYFVRSFPALHGPSFDIAELPKHLKGLKIVSIGEEYLGEEANVLIDNSVCLSNTAEANKYFQLA